MKKIPLQVVDHDVLMSTGKFKRVTVYVTEKEIEKLFKKSRSSNG